VSDSTQSSTDEARDTDPILSINHLFQPSTMASAPKRKGKVYIYCSPCPHSIPPRAYDNFTHILLA
jgi:hypothetical protein